MDSIDNNAELDSSTSEAEDHAKDPEALRRLAENCQALFKDCQRHPVLYESDWIDKMSADFNWWSLGTNATKSGHSSLDYRVQARDDVRNVLHKISQDDGEQELKSEMETTQSQLSNEEDSELDEQIYYIKTTLQFLSEISAAMRKSGTKFRHQRIDKRFNERSHSGHVAEDLSPYVCIYADCDKPDDMYISTDEWRKHLKDYHRVPRWICDTCWFESDNPIEFEFGLEEEWYDHMRTEHSGEYDDDDLPELVEASRLSQRFMFYNPEVAPEIALCLTHLELTLQRLTLSDDDLIDPCTLEGLEADIVARLASLNALMELGEKRIVDLPAPDTEALPSNNVRDPSLESTDRTALSSDLWYQAFQELDEKTREWIRDPSESKAENVRQWVTDLVTLIQEREEEYNDSSPKLNVRGCEIIWRDYASKAETLLATIGDIAVNFAFSLSTIICSALGKLMKTKVAQYKDLAAIFVCAEKVLSLTRRGMVYEIVYLQDASSNIATKELQKTLVDLYKALLQLLSSMPAQLIENQGWQFFQALAWSGEDAERVSVLSTHEHKLSMAIQACDTIRLTAHQKLLQSLSTPLRRVDKNVENLTVLLQKKSLDEALDYISVIPIESHHLEKRETRTPGTCEWLLQDPRFLKWEETSYSSILWLHGITGAGKSYLTSKVIDRYWFDNEKDAKHDEGFAYFYCSLSDPARRNPTSIYQSYIRQLAQLYHYPRRIHKSIFNLYYKAKREQRSLSFNECRTALSELLNSYPQTTLVLDALDECEVETRKVLMLDLNSLVTAAERPVKVYIASRMEVDIIRNLRHGSDISIDPSYGKGDIEKYIEQEMRLLSNKWKSVSESVRAKVSRTITDLGSGNFVLAYLQWEQVKKLKTNSSILRGLENLPRSLDEAYHDIYSQNNEAELVIFQRTLTTILTFDIPFKAMQGDFGYSTRGVVQTTA
ncbi:hypothetical protein TrVGV298_007327 [Trichoderma virens]|nr:hypothetical protein TrVGV298_007327 [Trichoderma virens]